MTLVTRFASFPLLILAISIIFTGCGAGSNSDESVSEISHPEFTRKNIVASSHYKPSGIITDTTPTFSWPKTQDATEYLLGHEDTINSDNWQLYTLTAVQADCANKAVCSYTPTDITFSISDEKAWWVKPQIPGQTTNWSSTHVFKFKQAAQLSSKPLSPLKETTETTLKPIFKWESVDNTSQYEFGYENISGGHWMSFVVPADQANCINSQCSFKPQTTNLQSGEIYQWWVRNYTNSTWADWSKGSIFSVDTSANPIALLHISEDESGEAMLYPSKKKTNFIPRYTHGIDSKIWAQGIAILDNGFYLMSKNIKVKNSIGKGVDKYISFNLFDNTGKSVANTQLDYSSHGQDLSLEKVANNRYYVYSSKHDGKGISRFIMDTSNIDFNSNVENNLLLDISFDRDMTFDNGYATTPTINEEKDKYAIVSYKNKRTLYIDVIDKKTKKLLKKSELDISGSSSGYYTQGIAMKGNYIYVVRGHWLTDGDYNVKKLYIINASTGNRLKSYSFSLQKASSYERIEPEGLAIIDDKLFVLLPTRKEEKRVIKLYPLIETL